MRLYVDVDGTGPGVVFTHGFGHSVATWAEQVDLLIEDHTVAAWDLRGHGRSEQSPDPSGYSRDLALADLDIIVDLVGGGPAILIGHSLGGYLSLAYAVARPSRVKALILVSAGPGFADAESRSRWNEYVAEAVQDFPVEPQVAGLVLQEDSLVLEGLGNIAVPVLQIVGELDVRYHDGVRYVENVLDSARTVTIAGAGHHPQRTHADDVNRIITNFVASVDE